jgi:predicted Fe-S protein YdhL (DUF1289 family)
VTEEAPDYTSPCNRICTLEPGTEMCMGCFRTLDEIFFWTRFSNAERQAVRDALAERGRQFRMRNHG